LSTAATTIARTPVATTAKTTLAFTTLALIAALAFLETTWPFITTLALVATLAFTALITAALAFEITLTFLETTGSLETTLAFTTLITALTLAALVRRWAIKTTFCWRAIISTIALRRRSWTWCGRGRGHRNATFHYPKFFRGKIVEKCKPSSFRLVRFAFIFF
jgi:hypothetical protein